MYSRATAAEAVECACFLRHEEETGLSLARGVRLGPYDIGAPLGAGGMLLAALNHPRIAQVYGFESATLANGSTSSAPRPGSDERGLS